METVRSADGTPIAYDRTGQGPVLIMVGGAMTTRNSGSRPQLASLLADRFTVIDYDRRGRGGSGDTQPYTPQREIEDIEALIDATGPAASLYGHSSGGCLALDAAVQLGPKVSKLAIYEAPYNDDPAVGAGSGPSTSSSSPKPWPRAAAATPSRRSCGTSGPPPSRSTPCARPLLGRHGGHRPHAGLRPRRRHRPGPVGPGQSGRAGRYPCAGRVRNRQLALHAPDRRDPEPRPPARRAPRPGRPGPTTWTRPSLAPVLTAFLS